MMTVALLPRAWETPRLAIEDSTRDEVPGLQEVCDACRYIEEWSGWKAEEHPGETMLSVFTDGELPPNGSKELFRLQSIRLRDTRQLIGFLEAYHGFPTPDTFWILYLAIHPRAQGQGYGQELVRALSQVLKRTGTYARIRLIVDLKNWPALRFWVQSGFDRIVNVQGDKVHSAETFACIVVEKPLVSHQ
jgi:ribosomal protein S18 acetylase RimI-like enzyme